MKQTSIKDIARLANVSHSTVSRALHQSPLVNHETAERIRRIALDARYRPSAVARSLVTRRTNTIGVVVTSIADPFVAEVVGGIEAAANVRGYSVILANSNGDEAREIDVVRSFEERRVDGIVVTSSRIGAMYEPLLAQIQVPIVLVNSQHASESVYSVMIANGDASREAIRHLLDLGHRQIAYIGDRFGNESETERYIGYRTALEEAGIPFRPELVVQGDGKPEGGALAMESLLGLAELPTAVFCYNDMTAIGALKCIRAHGFHVPEDISVVGFDDLYLAQFIEPSLTTIRQPKHEMGRTAADTVLRLLAGESPERNVKVPGRLIVRESTAPARRNRVHVDACAPALELT